MTTAADVICSTLKAHGISTAFGVPGSQTIAMHEAMRRSRLRCVLATNELAAGFMANGYYRGSGGIAPLMTIPGPGFLWALAAVAEALHDSVPLLHITAATPSSDSRKYLQAMDQAAIAATLVKGTFRIDSVDNVSATVAAAIALAREGEPGPVLLEYLPGVAQSAASAGSTEAVPTAASASSGADSLPDGLLATVLGAQRPVILAGQGCLEAGAELQQLATLLSAPLFTTTSARGVIPENDPFALCFDHDRGNVNALNELIRESDCLLAIGCKLGYAGSGANQLLLPQERMIRVDTSRETLDSTPEAGFSLQMRAEDFVRQLLEAVTLGRADARSQWTPARVGEWRQRLRSVTDSIPEPRVGGSASTTPEFFRLLRKVVPESAIIVTDSGLHQQLVRRHFDVLAPRGLIVPSDFQSMGFGLPAAIGAGLAARDRKVVLVIGDGGFAMSGLELITAVREKLPLTVLVLNDGRLGRICNEQLAKYGRSANIDLLNPDFRGMAQAMGAQYFTCGEDNETVLRDAICFEGVSVVEVPVSDALPIRKVQFRGLVRGAAHRVLGPGFVGSIKRALSRSS